MPWLFDEPERPTSNPPLPKSHVERVSCYKLRADHAERAGEIWAKKWVDVKEGA
jgi:hypothetical protein